MSKKGGKFFEEHIEKVIMGLVGLVCIWLLITRVFISPNVVICDNKKFGPGGIDVYISEQAELLRDKLDRKLEPKQAYKPRFGGFDALVDSAISGVEAGVYLPQPNNSSMEVSDKRAYHIPLIGEVDEALVVRLRAVAYVPTEKIDEENVYDRAETEVNDVDFVTVEAKFDVAGLVENFYESFVGDDIPEEWHDPCLANPVFAAVQLQRQELGDDGSWSDWQIVPRTKIDARRQMFEVIEKVEELPAGGIKVRLLQFDDAEIRADLLQPEAYKIASAKEEWFPPSLHKKYVGHQRELEAQEKREAKAAEREREKERSERRVRALEPRMRSDEGTGSDYYSDRRGDRGRELSRRRERQERESEKERLEKSKEISKTTSISDIYDEFDEILITEKTDLAKMHQPLAFWAHDDTVEPEKSYRYRTRLGVFNPIAGTNQFSEQDKSLKNNVILWSGFSDITETVEIPGRLYFFPREIQEAAKIVTVTVCRYVLGYWYSKDFTVKQGEVIGNVVDSEDVEEEKGVTIPERIDYATGAVLVDVILVNDWAGGKNLRARYYFDMLYSFDGTNIEHRPIKPRYWAEELQMKFNEIKKSEKEPKEPLRSWGGRPTRRRRPTPGLEYEEYDEYEKRVYGL